MGTESFQCLVFGASDGLVADVQYPSDFGNRPLVLKEHAKNEGLSFREQMQWGHGVEFNRNTFGGIGFGSGLVHVQQRDGRM